tara:strand:+ start:332 stop:745 length:414 start_codon:yes stop_codon:yes gene_type:complete
MLYIFPKNDKNINIEIIENDKIYKIKNIIHMKKYNTVTYGIIFKINNIFIKKLETEYHIFVDEKIKKKIEYYENILSNKIKDYQSILFQKKNNYYFKIKNNKFIDEIYNNNITNFFLNIKYVKKLTFLNIPVINIIK